MSKGLEVLEKLDGFKNMKLSEIKYFETIEKELQRLEAYDNELKEFDELPFEKKLELFKGSITINSFLDEYTRNKKVLEIIKKKDVDMYSLRRCETVEEYNIHFAIDEYQELTQEEFTLLKEVVRCIE